MKDDIITVYWSPTMPQWNILYEDPINCYSELISEINKDSTKINFFRCPSFRDLTKNIFLLRNPMSSHFIIDENMKVIPKSKNYIDSTISHSPSIKNNILFNYSISHYFFCEESLEVIRTAPYFHDVPHEKYGKVVPGKWDCGSWFRPIDNEINLWDNVKEFKIDKGEPLSYYYFNTNKKIILKRFYPSEKIMDIGTNCGQSSSWEQGIPLLKRYERFKNSKTNKILIDEIKKNVID